MSVDRSSTEGMTAFERELLKRLETQEQINRRMLQAITTIATDIGRYVDAVMEAEK